MSTTLSIPEIVDANMLTRYQAVKIIDVRTLAEFEFAYILGSYAMSRSISCGSIVTSYATLSGLPQYWSARVVTGPNALLNSYARRT